MTDKRKPRKGGAQPGAGRPGIGKPVQVRFGQLQPRIDAYAAAQDVSFAEAVRQLAETSLLEWEHWQRKEGTGISIETVMREQAILKETFADRWPDGDIPERLKGAPEAIEALLTGTCNDEDENSVLAFEASYRATRDPKVLEHFSRWSGDLNYFSFSCQDLNSRDYDPGLAEVASDTAGALDRAATAVAVAAPPRERPSETPARRRSRSGSRDAGPKRAPEPEPWESEAPLAEWEVDLLGDQTETEEGKNAYEQLKRRMAGGEKILPDDPNVLALDADTRRHAGSSREPGD